MITRITFKVHYYSSIELKCDTLRQISSSLFTRILNRYLSTSIDFTTIKVYNKKCISINGVRNIIYYVIIMSLYKNNKKLKAPENV